MAKISTYPVDGAIAGGDKLIGTDSTDGSTKNFTVEDLGAFINQNFPVPNLQQVLDEGNSATSDITLTGDISTTNGDFSSDVSVGGNLSVDGTFDVNGAMTAEAISCGDIISDGGGAFLGGLAASSLTADGEINGASATIVGNISAVGGTFSGNVSAVGGTFSGNVSAVQGIFSGPVELSDDLDVTGGITIGSGVIVNGGAFNVNVPATMSAINAGSTEVDSLSSNAQVEAGTYLSAGTDLLIGGGISLATDYGSTGQVIKSTGGSEPTAYWGDISSSLTLLIDAEENSNQISGLYAPYTITFGGSHSATGVSISAGGQVTFTGLGDYIMIVDLNFGNLSGSESRMFFAMRTLPDDMSNVSFEFLQDGEYSFLSKVMPIKITTTTTVRFEISKNQSYSSGGGLYFINPNTTVGSDLNPLPSARIRIYKFANS